MKYNFVLIKGIFPESVMYHLNLFFLQFHKLDQSFVSKSWPNYSFESLTACELLCQFYLISTDLTAFTSWRQLLLTVSSLWHLMAVDCCHHRIENITKQLTSLSTRVKWFKSLEYYWASQWVSCRQDWTINILWCNSDHVMIQTLNLFQ